MAWDLVKQLDKCTVLLEKQTATNLVKKFPAFIESEISIL
jgi:hypothetical protein